MKNTRFEYEIVTEQEKDGKLENDTIATGGKLFEKNMDKAVLWINRHFGSDIQIAEDEGKEVEILCRPFCSK